jgi:hypothetical protein
MFVIPSGWEVNKKLKVGGFHAPRLEPKEISCTVKKNKHGKTYFLFRFGSDVCNTLCLNHKDRIIFLFQKDFQNKMMIGKTDNDHGFAISKESNKKNCNARIMWTGELPLQEKKTFKIDFQYVQNFTGIEFVLPI